MKRLLIFLFCIVFVVSAVYAEKGTRFLHQPDISAELIVFVYANDLWTVPASGGEAKRLTTHEGVESSPKFSPDGKWIAFSGMYDGNTDVFVIPTDGGEPRRLTYHPGGDVVLGWTQNGRKVLFSSGRNGRYNPLHTVDISGGFPEMLLIPEASLACYSPDGHYLAYTPVRNAFGTWKRYRGGRTTPIWIIDLNNNSHEEIPHETASDTYPVWIGDSIYFMSDRNKAMNLFAYNTRTKRVRQLHSHTVMDIKYLSGGAGKLVYAAEGHIYVYDPNIETSTQIPITVPSELIDIRSHFKNISREIASGYISPTGKRAVFEAHGEILTVPAEKGDIRNLTQSTGIMERYPSWSPDGKSIAYFSDADGEYALCITDQFGNTVPKKITLDDPSFYYSPVWSPDSKNIAFRDKRRNLWYVQVSTLHPKKIDTDVASSDFSWSPDSKWIAYQRLLENRFGVLYLYSAEKETSYQLTDGMSDSVNPVFSTDGKYMFFRASTDIGPLKGGLDMSSSNRDFSYDIYITVLRDDAPSPFAPESDEEIPKTESKDEKSSTKKQEFRIDLENIDQRIITLPVQAGRYSALASAPDKLFYQNGSDLYVYDFKQRKADKFLSNVFRYIVSADGKKILYGTRTTWAIVPTAGKPKPGSGRLNLSTMEVRVDPRAEWKQMFYEAWRLNRDFFYDPYMHGVDWKGMLQRYEVYLPDLACRTDLNYLLSEMLGELCVGHSYVRGGFPRGETVPVGLLGADYEIANGRYRFKKIFSGLNWNPELRAPLTEPGVKINVGDYIISVNGKELRTPTNIYSLFEKTAGKQVTLTVNNVPSQYGAKTVTVVPVVNERSLRSRDWVEENRRKVEEMTNGQIGYIYLPNTGGGGYTYFNRYFFAQLNKKGLIVDERFNGGGKVADYIIDLMNRPLMNYWAPREGPDYTTPFSACFGPKVMIINEYAGSGGDWMPFYFRDQGVGPLVGKRTWGGLVGIGGTPRLMDGGSVTAPNFAIFSRDGKWIIENEGVAPDYEIEMIPKDFVDGHDPQLEKAVEVVLELLKKKSYKKTPRPPYPIKK